MIYLVSAQQRVFESDEIQQISIEESLEILAPLTVVGLDTETSGLSPWSDNLLLVQLGCHDFQVVIDTRTIDILRYKEYLESDRLFLLWNAMFDLQWMYKYNIVLKKVYDGFLAEKLLYLGYPSGMHSLSLKSAGENYLGISLDKSVRGKIIWSKTLSEDIIIYGAEDVAHLEDIKNAQEIKIGEEDLFTALDIENRFVRVIAYIEWCGVKIDEEKWKIKVADDKKRRDESIKACNNWLIENDPNSKYIYIDTQGDLFAENPFDLTPKVSLNWDSPAQMVKLFEQLGVNVVDKDGNKSTEAKVLKPQADKCSLIPLFLKYKEDAQVCKAFGEKFLSHINENSGRLHASWHPIGTDTGRVSCGEGGEESINLLNLPADPLTRSCFVAEDGNSWISIDYSGQETYLMASIANDKAIIDELTYGSGDIHSLTAYMSYSEIPRDTPIKDIKKLYHNLRQEAKGIEFAVNYGGDANTIAQNKGIPIEQANRIYNDYMNGFKGLKKYQDFRRKDWFEKGYILLSPLTKYRAHIYDYDQLLKDKEWMSTLDWNYYREMKRDCPECDTVQRVKHFFKRKSSSEKQSINYPIQHAGAGCSKIALINFFNWIINNGYFNKVKITIIPYDEVNCEAPKEIAEMVANQLYTEMVDSGKIFCTRCKLDADISRNEDGSLPDHWVH